MHKIFLVEWGPTWSQAAVGYTKREDAEKEKANLVKHGHEVTLRELEVLTWYQGD